MKRIVALKENSDRNAEHDSAKVGMARRILRTIALLWRIVWFSISRVLVLLFVILLAADIWLECIGVPDCICKAVKGKASNPDVQFDFDVMQCGLVRGVVLHNVRCTAKTPAGNVSFKSERLAVRPDFRDLVKLEVFPQEFIVENGDAVLMNPLDKDGGLEILDINLKCGLKVDERLSVNVNCSCFGLPLDISVQLSEARSVLKRLFEKRERKPVEFDEELQRKLAEVSMQLRNLTIPSKESSQLKVEVSGPMASVGRWKYKGSLNLQGARWSGLEIPYYSTVFHGSSQILSLDDMKLWLGRSDIVSGKAEVFFGDREFQAHCDGHLTRASVEYVLESLKTLLKWERKPSLEAVPWNELAFDFDFNRSALTLESMDMLFSCQTPETDYGLLGKGNAKLSARLKDGKLTLEEAEVVFSAARKENLTLSGSWNIGTNEITGAAKARLNLRRCLVEMGVTLPEKFIKLPDEPCEADISIKFPDGTLEGVALSGRIEQKGGKLLGMDCSSVQVPFELAHGKVSVNKLEIIRDDIKRSAIGCAVECDVRAAMQTGVARVDVKQLEINGRERDDSSWGKALESTGYVVWKSRGKQLAFRLSGKVYPESVYREYLRQYEFDVTNMLMRIDCAQGSPATFELEMPEKSLEDATAWKIDGNLSFGKVRFNGLDIERVDCDGFTITAKNCTFRNLHVVTADKDDASFDLRVVYSPLSLTFSNALLDGRPEIIGYFIPDSTVSEFYTKIFSDITWNMDVKPHLQMPKLVYSYTGHQWRVICDGIYANVHDVKFRGLKVDEATVIITLRLPSKVIIEPLNIRLDDRSIRGKIELQLVGAKQCNFQIHETLMGADLHQVFEGLFPNMAEKVSDVSISQDCILACHGSLFLDGEPRLFLEGTMEANEVVFREQCLQQVSLGWRYDDGDIWWDLKDAVMFSGHVKTSGHYDIERAQGQLLVIIKDISLNDLVGKLSKDEKTASSYHGNVSGELEVDILHGWAGRPMHLNGQGHLNIREGELWSIPVLSKLGQIIKSASFGSVSAGLGQISELNADIELNGVSISVPNIRTNGTILSLNGNADFHWDEDWRKGRMHLLINVVPVKDVKLLSLLLSPLAGMFQAELTGTLDEYSWKIRTFIDKLF